MHGTDISPDDLSRLIDRIYEGAAEAVPWQQSLESLRSALRASYATLILRPAKPGDPGFMVNAGAISSGALDAYESTYYALDPFIDLPVDEVHTVAEILGEAGWRESAFYQQFNAPLDIFHILGADLADAGGDCRLRICRPHGAPAFDAADKAFCARLLPHFKRALRLHGRLERSEVERRLYASAVERMRIGTLILDSRQQVLESNQAACELLAAGDGLFLLDGCLQASVRRDDLALQRLIAQASRERQGGGPQVAEAITLARPSGRAALGVVVQSLPGRNPAEGKQAQVAVFLRDPEQTASVPQQSLRQLFGFTPAEAALAAQLANGLSLEDASLRLNISRNTAKAHLRSIFGKAGVNRQSELACVLHSSVAFLCAEKPGE